ncbi:6-hydroxymethylpterin diphosphokinase MptE-like protein [Natronomonas salsuginis]|uniref:6-hydroxymethyl-7,8-dihydropterin pyrophosphokinase n=1 Tax=Natronomonas salsuginis TaxID=2217661 RepID=A0A4U5JF40_9EURY|nr:6-hydroxymethylpterin diphosphokinase MptE-like protein [Natronomonas salsuginis]TKR27784.1 DUF115 domain-containing protein [Natronomonas salsuginis]
MLFDEWEPVYEAILDDFGYERAADERARDRLAALVGDADPPGVDDVRLSGSVAICGAGPTLSDELDVARRADSVIAASTAADVCLDAGIGVDCMVTDLDKNPDTARALSESGIPVAAHAHGDNVPELERYVPTFVLDSVLPTTQAAPAPPVSNPGGFTDGDRAAFLADACGADRLVFPGWSFDDPSVSAEKARKLRWAERLLHWLEERRGERFDVLDGRRDRIDRPWGAE